MTDSDMLSMVAGVKALRQRISESRSRLAALDTSGEWLDLISRDRSRHDPPANPPIECVMLGWALSHGDRWESFRPVLMSMQINSAVNRRIVQLLDDAYAAGSDISEVSVYERDSGISAYYLCRLPDCADTDRYSLDQILSVCRVYCDLRDGEDMQSIVRRMRRETPYYRAIISRAIQLMEL